MASQPPLIVPVQVDALLVNRRVRDNEPHRRWYPEFDRLDRRYPPEPDPFQSSSSGKPGLGVHLHWLLPDALRRGRQDGPAGRLEFPAVPNRWLVVRYSRPAARPGEPPTATGWVVDSDYLSYDDGTSPFLDPFAEGLEETYIGRAHDLSDGPWTEPGGRRKFLTAIGPGLPTFAGFQPYNENVFSLHDPLRGLTEPSLISYAVAGWYSDPTWDILHAPPAGDVRALLEHLRWSTTDPALTPTRSFCAGTAVGLRWEPDGDRPESDKPDVREVDVAVGHIVTDAETALHPPTGDDPEAALLWRAFVYDLLDVLDDGGEDALEHATRRTWFGAEPGGYTWRIVDRPAPPEGAWPQRSARQIAEERQWLAELNEVQDEHDAACRELSHLQRRLYGLWWLRGRENRPAGWDVLCDAQLEPGTEGSLAQQVRRQLVTVFGDAAGGANGQEGDGGLRARIPWGDTAGDLADAVEDYADRHQLAPGRELQRCADPAFHSTPDPSVIVRGARIDRPLTDENALPCRVATEAVTEVLIDGEMARPPADPPAPDLSGLPEPGVLAALLGEFFLLDRAAVTPGADPGRTALEEALASPETHVSGVIARWTRPWRQPWSPLHLIWKMNCFPTPYRSGDDDNWHFDGTRYRWKGTNAVLDPGVLTGRALLSPLPGFDTRARLAQHADTHPRGPVAELRELRARAEEWDQLSQRIDGVNHWLAQHSPAFNMVPSDELGDLVDNSRSRVPLGDVPDPGPASGSGPREFRPVRAGQLAFEQLHVIDRFGRSLAVISPDNVDSYPVLRALSVTPDIPVFPENEYRYVELPPRLIQPARLRFDFVSARDDHHQVDVDAGPREAAGESPVCGWVIANHLAGSLLVHAPEGHGLGEIRLVLDTGHRRIAAWYPLPDSPYPDPDPATGSGREFAADLPHLHGFVVGVLDGGEAAFTQLLEVVDRSMSATVPGGDDDSLAALVGRPMALLRSRLRLELDGPAMTSSSWDEVIAPEPPEFTSYMWNVRLGAGDMLGDGLAGFYLGTRYTRLHAVPEPPARSTADYAVPIDGLEIALPARPASTPARLRADRAEDERSSVWVTLLADPWAAVHAVSDILPVSRLLLPPTWVREPLSRMRLAFRMGPLLAGTRRVPGEEGSAPAEHVVMPGPSGRRGTWSWAEPAAADGALPAGGPGSWTTLPLTSPDDALALSDTTPAARTGFLQLTGALGETDAPPTTGSSS
ncbi:hypothetical protein [Streptomyces sp. NPDC090022]|uniref:hypothetical protein n=1 Tax=Streptomyces sp. NPDC090022 TaxID=3365920 RepID=UPI0037F3829F